MIELVISISEKEYQILTHNTLNQQKLYKMNNKNFILKQIQQLNIYFSLTHFFGK